MSGELAVGTRIQVKQGVTAPEMPEVSIAGWTGRIAEKSGKKANRKYIIEWDQSTLEAMPQDYLQACEEKQLYHAMACLKSSDIEVLDE